MRAHKPRSKALTCTLRSLDRERERLGTRLICMVRVMVMNGEVAVVMVEEVVIMVMLPIMVVVVVTVIKAGMVIVMLVVVMGAFRGGPSGGHPAPFPPPLFQGIFVTNRLRSSGIL